MAKLKIINRFGITPNEILNSTALSWKAKGLYWYIQSKPENRDFAVNRISKETKDGKDGTTSGIKELEDAGYLVRRKYKNDKGQWDTEYTLYDQPITENPEPENPATENPEINKKINTNKEEEKSNNIIMVENVFDYKIAEDFLNAHIENETPWVLYKLKNIPREEIIKSFAGGVEKLQRLDGYNEKQIEFIINYIIENTPQQNPGKGFYRINQIQTIDKLRTKNKEGIPYFIALIDQAKEYFTTKKQVWTLEI
jgi:hypothetical protein